MLTLRRETDYAIHMLKHLAKNKVGYVSLRELAEDTGISFLFLQKIARKMRQARLIKAGAGVSGGYCLNIPAERVTLKKIIVAVEGSAAILPCMCANKSAHCKGKGEKCALKQKLAKVNKQIDSLFDKMKLTDM
ncbi:MAG: Rrf2 family transcriptional regulator [Patescibacteria group bacterium]|nr:Rrf2 family transcriptional regulator [Patescibacteria group bacterium]